MPLGPTRTLTPAEELTLAEVLAGREHHRTEAAWVIARTNDIFAQATRKIHRCHEVGL